MDLSVHTLTDLFDQLGLPSWEEAIDHFFDEHAPLDESVSLIEAPFWNDGQKVFLKEALDDDSDWCEIVDQLDARLRS